MGLGLIYLTYSLPMRYVSLVARLSALGPGDWYLTDYDLGGGHLAVKFPAGQRIESGAFGVADIVGHPHFPYGHAVDPD